MPYLDSLDIANRALQHCGAEQILTVSEDSKNNKEAAFAYDKVRRAELRRNTWRFATRKAALRAIDTNTLLLNPAAWSSTTTYLPGAIVKDSNGQLWLSTWPDNVNNEPATTDAWDMYFGPMTASLYDSTAAYYAGELVYKPTGTSAGYVVYMSLVNGNSDDPATANAWSSTTTYTADQVVSYSGYMWRSLLPYNLNVTPAVGPSAFDITATYSAGNTVTGSDNFIYSSVGNGNVGNDPTTDGGTHWTNTNVMNGWAKTPTVPTSATSWRVIGASLSALSIIYPIGAGPSSNANSRNLYRLPAGYLCKAPQDPTAGAFPFLGAPTNRDMDDWQFEGDYITSMDSGPLVFRFVADVTDVSTFDDMFCEGLACRLAEAICEPVTQSRNKLADIQAEYKIFMGEARSRNLVELGAIEPSLDQFISCRF